MTWTKLSDDYGDECRELSDAAFRTHTEALLWVMRRETGGYVDDGDVRRFAESPHARIAVDELVAVGWWSIDGQGYRVHHHMEHQPEPDLLAKRRELTADRVRKHRRKKAGLDTDVTPLRDALPGTGRDGTGRDGKDAVREPESQNDPRFWKTHEELTP